MTNISQHRSKPVRITTSIANAGAWLGLKTGFFACLLYIICYALVTVPLTAVEPELSQIGLGFVVVILLGGLGSLVPAISIGSVTGWLVGLFIQFTDRELSRGRVRLVAIAICGGIALIVNCLVVFRLAQPLDPEHYFFSTSYLVFFGIPTIIYMVLGARMSVRLYESSIGAS